ncbi:hypothetical protein KC19_6G049500 [Ceratodon purpureus]|uniref:Secreted protein n=1 Tax=Ceratodon purpureus TaxID=3225 RepID=A0A8T0HHW4_CERPU|nr:hypothetical protein KC19_6G049500 [Ceratodon purpureus]
MIIIRFFLAMVVFLLCAKGLDRRAEFEGSEEWWLLERPVSLQVLNRSDWCVSSFCLVTKSNTGVIDTDRAEHFLAARSN